MTADIITIGDELMIGQVVDTNSAYMALRLRMAGFEVGRMISIPDNGKAIASTVEASLREADMVITTGGLGPTKDDITKETLMRVFGGSLIRNEEVMANIKTIVERRGINLNPLTANQCLVPSSCRVLPNRFGTAPVMWFEKNGKILVSLPGVPFEMQGCFDGEVLPALLSRLQSDRQFYCRTFILSGITESDLSIRLSEFEEGLDRRFHLAYLPQFGLLRLRLDGAGAKGDSTATVFRKLCSELKCLTADFLLADDDLKPAEILLKQLERSRLTLSTAESCTGGAIASAITACPGSSRSFKGSVVAYSNEVKHNVLGVANDLLDKYGAVSQPVAEAMAKGVSGVCLSDCSISTSGIAGPDGGTPEKPVGTVCIAIKIFDTIISHRYHFSGDRRQIVQRAVNTAIVMLIQNLKNN